MKKIKVKINKLPAGFHQMPDGTIMRDSDHKMAAGGQNGYALKPGGGYEYFESPDKNIRMNKSLGAVPRALANLEAEKGESVVTDLDKNGTPENYNIGGQKHSNGGTPLNLPAKSFIFSDHKSMALKGEELKRFTNTSKKSMTPAQLAKLSKFDLTKDNAVLKDPNADRLAIATAERNIQNKLVKLGELALAQEGKKAYEGGIPDIALPYLMTQGVDPSEVEAFNSQVRGQEEMPMARYGLEMYQVKGETEPQIKRATPPQINPDLNRDGRVTQREQEYYDRNIVPAMENFQGDQLGYGQSASMTIPGMPGGVFRRGTAPITVSRSVGNLPAQREVKAPSVTRGEYSPTLDYGSFEQTFSRPEFEPVKKAMYESYKAQNPSDDITYDQFLGNFMKAQKDNRAIFEGSQSGKYAGSNWAKVTDSKWDEGTKNKYYREAAKDLGFEPMSDQDTKRFQAGYKILADLQSMPEYANVLQDFDLKPIGKSDQQYLGKPISPADEWYGNTTIGQIVRARTRTDVPGEYAQDPAEEVYSIDEPQPEEEIKKRKPQFWAQDNVNMLANLGQTDVYELPLMTRINASPADPLFKSPERGIQATAETYGKAIDQFGQMGSAQNFGNVVSALGASAANAQANYDAQIQNENVGIYNQFSMANAELENRINQYNQEAQAGYRAGEATASQGRRNFKNEKLAQTAKVANTAMTNRAQADMLNQLYPQYNVDPRTGGLGVFTGVPGQIGTTPVDSMMGTYQKAYENQPKEENVDKKVKEQENPPIPSASYQQELFNAFQNVLPKSARGGQTKMYQALRKFIK